MISFGQIMSFDTCHLLIALSNCGYTAAFVYKRLETRLLTMEVFKKDKNPIKVRCSLNIGRTFSTVNSEPRLLFNNYCILLIQLILVSSNTNFLPYH